MSKNNLKLGKIIYISASLVLVASFIVVVLEKTQTTDFYNKPTTQSEEINTRPVNDIDYSPADSTENAAINDAKASGDIISNNQQASSDEYEPINVVLTASNQDKPGGPIVIRVLLNNVKSGECRATLTKDDVVKNYIRSVVNAGTYYNCEALNIPVADLSDGSWNLSVDVTSGSRSGSIEKNIEVKL